MASRRPTIHRHQTQHQAPPNELRMEFDSVNGGGLLTLATTDDGRLLVDVTRCDDTVTVRHNDAATRAVRELVTYNWSDEQRDYADNYAELAGSGIPHGHIFAALVTLDNWLNGRKAQPEDYLPATDGA